MKNQVIIAHICIVMQCYAYSHMVTHSCTQHYTTVCTSESPHPPIPPSPSPPFVGRWKGALHDGVGLARRHPRVAELFHAGLQVGTTRRADAEDDAWEDGTAQRGMQKNKNTAISVIKKDGKNLSNGFFMVFRLKKRKT